MRNIQLLAIALLAIGSTVPRGLAQTPWQTAPAKPAPLPAAQQSGGSIVSLPPPPAKTPSPSVSTPAFVSLTAAPIKATPAPPAAKRQAPPPLPTGPITPTGSAAPQRRPLPGLPGLAAPSGSRTSATMASSTTAKPANQLAAFAQGTPIEATELQSGQLVAVVGNEHILAGDMSVFVEPIIEQNRAKIDSDETERKLRTQLTRQVLKQYITIKAMYIEFFRDMVGTGLPKEFAEMQQQVVTRASRIFHEKQVPTLIEKYKVASVSQLEEALAKKNMSLLTMQKQFIEQVLSQEMENKAIPREFEVERAELLKYYREQGDEWNMPAKAKWRQITVRFDKHDRTTAKQLIDNLFNQIYLGGKSFDAVARQNSEGYTADEGGQYDWTTRGSLKSKTLDAAIFTMPVRQLSGVIEDEVGYHVLEITERQDRHVKDFLDAQVEIRKILSDEKRSQAREELREKVLARTPVWTLWPEDLPDLKMVYPLADVVDAP